MAKDSFYLGIDLGATSVKAGVVSADKDDKKLLSTVAVPTAQRNRQDVLDAIIHSARQAVEQSHLALPDITAVCVASPGPIDLETQVICDSPNIEDWQNVPLGKILSDALGRPTVLENDANAAALGEFHLGAGRSATVMALFTLGSGIGGGVVIDGQVLHGAHGFAAELGHVIVVPDGRLCGCGQHGCAEAYASANSTIARATEALDAGRASSLAQVLRDNTQLTAKDVADHARRGDPLAEEILDGSAYYLALLSLNVRAVVDPQMVVLGGGMSHAGDILLTAVRKHFKRLNWHLQGADRCRIELAVLGNDAGMIGAAMAAAKIT
ncbi:MAG: ROK family protein [Actinobacteria bacterium]|nr:ROK family protein [Actinomycetota bacterium]